jgi:tetratricopeptide (TPR) repeat protein
VVDALKVSLLGDVPRAKEIKPEAYALYLQGKHFNGRRTEEGHKKAVDALQAALKLEPEYVPAWNALGEAYWQQSGRFHDVHETISLARAAYERALTLDAGSAEAHAGIGWIKSFYDFDWQGAEKAMQRALSIAPENVESLMGVAALASALGKPDESIVLNQRAIELDPLNTRAHLRLGMDLLSAARLNEAAATFRQLVELDPQYPYVHLYLGMIFLWQDEPQMALMEMQKETDPVSREYGNVLALSTLGRKVEADQAMANLVRDYNMSDAFLIACAYAWRGDKDQAFVWLDRAYEQRDYLISEILMYPELSNLKSDPRWPAFLEKMGLPH